MKGAALGTIRLYQRAVSPALPSVCRYEPSCSEYCYQAIEKHGLLRGIWLGLRRLGRCHPLQAARYDPVP
jgi:putative membrane protein insertion efficiency factor